MPTKPANLTITNVSADVINAIRNTGSINYRDYIPVTTPDADSIRHVGSIIMDSPNLRNAFASDLINLVIKVIITSKIYETPLARLKKGMLELGETVEEIFVNIARAELYDPALADQTVFKRRIPDIRATFHVVNSQIKYPVTISNEQLSMAFRTQDGLYKLIESIYTSLYAADAYDDFNIVKYLIADHIVHGRIKAIPASAPSTEAGVRAAVTTIKATGNRMQFMTGDYNIAGVKTHAQHREQTLLISADFDAAVDVNVLAAAFNMDKAEFLSKRILVDSFGSIDIPRLAECCPELCKNIVIATDENGRPYVVSAELANISADQLAALDAVPAVLIDDEFVQEYDRLITMEDIRNPDGLYTNAFLHVWRIYSTSPFAPAAVFDTTDTPEIGRVTIIPDDVVATPGSIVNFAVHVSATGFIDQSVNWSVTNAESTDTYIDAAGNLHIGTDETSTELRVYATPVSNPSNYAEAIINVIVGPSEINYDGAYNPAGPDTARTGTMVTVTAAVGSVSSVGSLAISVIADDTSTRSRVLIPYTASITGSGSNHTLTVEFIMPNGPVTVTVAAAV